MREQICKMNPEKRGHDACGIGAVVDRWGRPSRQTVEDALEIVEHLEHRAGKDASGQTGDGVGILLQICHPFFVAAAKEVGLDLAQAEAVADLLVWSAHSGRFQHIHAGCGLVTRPSF